MTPIDPTNPMEPDRQLTPDDILRYWQEKGAKAECELCGHPGWKAHNESGWYSAYMVHDPIIYPRGLLSVPTIVGSPVIYLSCDNCGNVRLIYRSLILSWLRNIKHDD